MIYEVLIWNFEVALKPDFTDDNRLAFRLLRAVAWKISIGGTNIGS